MRRGAAKDRIKENDNGPFLNQLPAVSKGQVTTVSLRIATLHFLYAVFRCSLLLFPGAERRAAKDRIKEE